MQPSSTRKLSPSSTKKVFNITNYIAGMVAGYIAALHCANLSSGAEMARMEPNGYGKTLGGSPFACPPSPSPRYRQRWVVPILPARGMSAPFILIPPPPVYSFDVRPCWPRLHSTTQKASSRNRNPSAVGGGQSRRDDPKREQAFLICLFSLVRSAYCAPPSVMYYQGPPYQRCFAPLV